MFKNIVVIITYILTFFISGCYVQIPHTNTIPITQQMRNWHAEGRVAIQDATQSQTASFTWQQNGSQYEVYIYSPFSPKSITIAGDATSKRIVNSIGLSDTELNLDEMLPLKQLGYWAKGIPAPTSKPSLVQYDCDNKITSILQDNWQITYQKYHNYHEASLPEKFTLTNKTIKIKIFIKYL